MDYNFNKLQGCLLLESYSSKEIFNEINDLSCNLIESFKPDMDYSNKLAGKIKNGIQCEITLNDLSEKAPGFKDYIEKLSEIYVLEYFKTIDEDPENFTYSVNDIWIVKQEASDYNPPHRHFSESHLSLSGVLYLRVPGHINIKDKDGCIQFLWGRTLDWEPREDDLFMKTRIDFDIRKNGLTYLTPDHIEIAPVPGALWLFPSALMHQVFPFRDGGTRISIAFNINVFEENYAKDQSKPVTSIIL